MSKANAKVCRALASLYNRNGVRVSNGVSQASIGHWTLLWTWTGLWTFGLGLWTLDFGHALTAQRTPSARVRSSKGETRSAQHCERATDKRASEPE